MIIRTDARQGVTYVLDEGDWDESAHPRAENGQFGEGDKSSKAGVKAQDKQAKKSIKDYANRYAVNRPFNAPEKPQLLTNSMSDGRSVYNRSGGGDIARFSTHEIARKAIREITGEWVP